MIQLTNVTMQSSNDAVLQKSKDKHAAKMTLDGVFAQRSEFDTLQNRFVEESWYKGGTARITNNTGVGARGMFRQKFNAVVQVEKRPPDKYERQLSQADEDEDFNPRRNNQRRP